MATSPCAIPVRVTTRTLRQMCIQYWEGSCVQADGNTRVIVTTV